MSKNCDSPPATSNAGHPPKDGSPNKLQIALSCILGKLLSSLPGPFAEMANKGKY